MTCAGTEWDKWVNSNWKPWNTQWVIKYFSWLWKKKLQRGHRHSHLINPCCPFSPKARRSTGHDSMHTVEWAATAINNSEKNQIWRTGGENWWDHTYPYVSVSTRACVCACVNMQPHKRPGSEEMEMESDWHHADSQTDEQSKQRKSSRTQIRIRLKASLWLRAGKWHWGYYS